MHALRHRVAILAGEGLLASGVLVSDALGGVMFQSGLHVGYSGLEGRRGEARSSHSSSGEDPAFDVGDVLVEEQLVAGVTGYGRVSRTKLLPAPVLVQAWRHHCSAKVVWAWTLASGSASPGAMYAG